MSEKKRTETSAQSAVKDSSAFKKFLRLSRTLQFAWFAGHVTTLVASIFCFISANQAVYRIAWLGVIESFGIITYQHYASKSKATSEQKGLTPQALLQNGDVLYFLLALMWFITPKFTLALVPYAFFSLFHVLIYCKSILLPEVFGLTAENSKVVSLIANFVRNFNERCMYWVGSMELNLFLFLALRALLWYPRSWIILVAYTLFIKIRFENSKYMQATFAQWRVRFDGAVSHPSIPPVLKRGYGKVKSLLIQVSQFRLSKPQPAAASAGSKEHSQKAN
ncbi:hypothetical protein HG536_0D03710 [Torulaspora globosa]|uniref:Pore membrane protein of 33 kDa n=1 Tax=Torulaspora globosa TaxID=48254 RepID=A0A7G3ZH63_9SACH|nr:uncharacterized protein HG536_0D03710 [Torulaspora globosa]QLL32849.1 hypothetical protein HG536_0D03710 [Torulaspora globosa]